MSVGWVDPVAYEINREKAGSLGRTGKKLELAIAAIQRCEDGDRRMRDALVWDAAELVTSIIVQREACGLRNPKPVFAHYDVPAEVIARIGVARRR